MFRRRHITRQGFRRPGPKAVDDSIETSRDRMVAKFHRRSQTMHVALAFGLTLLEAIATLLGLRALWRGLRRLAGRPRRQPAITG